MWDRSFDPKKRPQKVRNFLPKEVRSKAGCRDSRRHVRCGRALLQSAVAADLLVVQVLEGEPVTEG